jgi:methionine synthase II (cobalamin-independent)
MSDSDPTDEALQRVRDSFETAEQEAEELSEAAREEVTDAIDDLEERINELRGNE